MSYDLCTSLSDFCVLPCDTYATHLNREHTDGNMIHASDSSTNCKEEEENE